MFTHAHRSLCAHVSLSQQLACVVSAGASETAAAAELQCEILSCDIVGVISGARNEFRVLGTGV